MKSLKFCHTSVKLLNDFCLSFSICEMKMRIYLLEDTVLLNNIKQVYQITEYLYKRRINNRHV